MILLFGFGRRDVADALNLREASYPAVQYIPRKDVDMAALERTEHASYCPYKGDAAYFSIPAGGERSVNAIWTYEAPYEIGVGIRDHIAFYPERVDAIDEVGQLINCLWKWNGVGRLPDRQARPSQAGSTSASVG